MSTDGFKNPRSSGRGEVKEEFEAWLVREVGPNYKSVWSGSELHTAELAWQAASKAMQERCAEV